MKFKLFFAWSLFLVYSCSNVSTQHAEMTAEYFCSHPDIKEYQILIFEGHNLYRNVNKENGTLLLKCTGGGTDSGCSILENVSCLEKYDKDGSLAAYWDGGCRRYQIKQKFINDHGISKQKWKSLSSNCWYSPQNEERIGKDILVICISQLICKGELGC